METLNKLNKELKAQAKTMDRVTARYIVGSYYRVQRKRIRAEAQVRAGNCGSELVKYEVEQYNILEGELKKALGIFSKAYTVGRWLQGLCGIGPVISAGILAHIDITKAPTYGNIWSFAGLVPGKLWLPGTKRPWNAELKSLLVYKLGESFVKVQSNKNDYYGKLFATRKKEYWELNFQGKLDHLVKAALTRFAESDSKAASYYRGEMSPSLVRSAILEKSLLTLTGNQKVGDERPMLPPAHVHAMARRYCIKLFVAHLHHVMFEDFYNRLPPKPYPFDILNNRGENHTHYLEPPSWPIQDCGLRLTELR